MHMRTVFRHISILAAAMLVYATAASPQFNHQLEKKFFVFSLSFQRKIKRKPINYPEATENEKYGKKRLETFEFDEKRNGISAVIMVASL